MRDADRTVAAQLEREYAVLLVGDVLRRAPDQLRVGHVRRFAGEHFRVGTEGVDAALAEYARRSGKPVLEYQAPEAEGFDNYNKFYEEL